MRWSLIFGGLLFVSSPAAADPLSDYAEWVNRHDEQRVARLEQRAATCTPQTATRVVFGELGVASNSLVGECVTITGIAWGDYFWRIYAAPEFMYASDRFASRAHPTRGPSSGDPYSIGIEGTELETPEMGGWFYEVTVTGMARDCDTFNEYSFRAWDVLTTASGPEGPIFFDLIGGYCHYHENAVIDATSIVFGERLQYPRLTGTAARGRLGALFPAPPDWEHHAEASQLAEQFVTSLRASDRPALGAMLDAETATTMLDDPTSPFRELRLSSDPPQIVLLRLGPPPRYGRPRRRSRDDRDDAYACFCREPDCSERWPIATFDTIIDVRRPYACLAYGRFLQRGTNEAMGQLRTSPLVGPLSPFHEPDSPAPNPR